jgi:hypothetical protein
MTSHRLVLTKPDLGEEWLLQWDCVDFILTAPDGETGLVSDTSTAHRLLDVSKLYLHHTISFDLPNRNLVFKRNRPAADDLCRLLEQAVSADCEFRREMLLRARVMLALGIALFVVGGTISFAYISLAGFIDDLPAGHWIRVLKPLIHFLWVSCTGAFNISP